MRVGVQRGNSLRRLAFSRRRAKSLDFINTLYDTPLLRGKIHIFLLLTSPVWAGHMLISCKSKLATLGALVSIGACVTNFASSAMLHNVHWTSLKQRLFWRQLDHMGIFLMISGSAAPVPFLTFGPEAFRLWLAAQVVNLVMGGSVCFFGDRFSNRNGYGVRALIFVILGLSNLYFTGEFRRMLDTDQFIMLAVLASGYVMGACFYGFKRPNPLPDLLGYHECFHIFCLASGISTYLLNLSVIQRQE